MAITQTDGRVILADLPTHSLKIDPTYQRRLSQARVDQMAFLWDDALAGALEVSSRDGSYFVLDGQHRLVAARKAGVSHLSVIIHEGLTPEQEATRFALLNTSRVRPAAYDIFRARKRAGEPLVLEIVRTCQHFGVPIVNGGESGYGTYAVTTLEHIASQSMTLLEHTLEVAVGAWPGDSKGVAAVPLKGIASFIGTYGNHPAYRKPRLVEKLSAFPPSHVMQRAKELGTTRHNPQSKAGGALGSRLAVLELYNRHLRDPLPMATQLDLRAIDRGQNPWIATTD